MNKTAEELIETLKKETESQEHEKTRQVLKVLLGELIKSFKQFEIELPQALIEIAQAIKTELPEEQNVKITNTRDLQSIFKPSEKVKIDAQSLKVLTDSLEQLKTGIEKIKIEYPTLPTDAKNPISVRLSDGKKFIEQLTQVIHQAQTTGGGSVPKITVSGGVQAVPIVNPDGSNLSLSVGDISGVSAYSDSGDTDKKGLVDGDRHVQVDVLTAPATLSTAANQSTIIGHLDGVEGLLTTIDADTGNLPTIETNTDFGTVTGGGTETGALRVTIANNSTGVLSVDDNSGSLTVDGTVTANLAAGTNAIGKLLAPDIDVTAHTNYAKKYYTNAGAVTDGIIWSPAAGKRWHVVSLFIQVSAASTVTLEDDLAGGDSPVLKMELAANSGIVIPFPEKYPLASGEDAADLIITTTAGNVYVTAVGYEI